MPGTILKDDLQSSIEDQLSQYANELTAAPRRGLQVIGDTAADLAQAGRTSAQDVQAQLSDYATQAYNQAQEAQRQAAQAAADKAAAVQKELLDHANQAIATNQSQSAPPQQSIPAAAGAPALPNNEEPATSSDTTGLGSKWKTQFDFGAVYTGDYRTGTPHRGVDLVPSDGKGIGTEVDAFTPGTVTNIFRDSGAGGLMVYVQDADGLTHAYMHLANTAPGLAVGQQVQRGTPIAQMGESGTEGSPHLHYEVRKNASNGDPLNQLIDPRPYEQGTRQPGGAAAAPTSPTAPVTAPLQAPAQQQQTGASTALPQSAFDYKVNGGQSLSRDQVVQAGQQVGLSADEAGYLYDSGVRNNVDAASALAIIKLEGNAKNPNNNMFDISNAMYGGHAVPGSRWGQYDSKQQAIDAYYQLINKEYIPNGQDTIGTIMHGPGSTPTTSTSHAYAPTSENRSSYPQEVLDQVKQWGGQAQQAVTSAVDQTVGGATQKAKDVLQVGTDALGGAQDRVAKAPIVYDSQTGGAQTPQQQLTAIQNQLNDLQAQLANAPEQARQAVGGAAGAAGAAGETIGGAASALGGAVSQTNQNIRTALGGTGAEDTMNLGPSTGGGAVLGAKPQPFDEGSIGGQVESGQRDIRSLSPGEGLQYTGQALAAGIKALPETYQALAGAKRQAIEQNNPIRDVVFAGGASSMLADVVTDPVTWVLPWGRVASGAVEVASRLGLSGVPAHIVGDAAMNGLQNATYELAQPDPTPEKVGVAFAEGAGFGAAVRGLQSTPVARAIGQYLMEQRGRGFPALQNFLRDESGELRIPGQEPRPAEKTPTTRVYHGTGSEFDRPSIERARGEESLYGPGYYLTTNPDVAGGVVGPASQATIDNIKNNIAVHTRTLEQRLDPGYTLPKGARGTLEDWRAADRDELARLQAQLEEVQGQGYVQGRGYAQAGIDMTRQQALVDSINEDQTYLRSMQSGPLSRPGVLTDLAGEIEHAKQRIADATTQLDKLGRPNVRAVDLPEITNRPKDYRPHPPDFADTPEGQAHMRNIQSESADQQRMLSAGTGYEPDPANPGRQRPTAEYQAAGERAAAARQAYTDARGEYTAAHPPDQYGPVDTNKLHMFDIEQPVTQDTLDAVQAVLRSGGDPHDRILAEDLAHYAPVGSNGEDLYDVLSRTSKQYAAETLQAAGFDGISYSGGKRIPLTRPDGGPIEHDVHVLFPSGMDKARNAVSGRQGGQVNLPFATNLAGAAFGGAAGNLATPSDATPEERARNIAAGAATGLVGTHLLTRGGLRLAAEGARSEPGGFRAPEQGSGPELRATTQEPPGGPPTGGPTGPAPRSLGEVATNRYALREARPGETPMTQDELSSHYDTMDARLQQVQARSDAVDEMLRNPGQKVERPPWATGYTSEQVATMARSVDHSPFEPLWWEKAGLESGSGEVRELLNESGGGAAAERGAGQRDLTPAELRAERNDLAKEKRDILAAGEQLGNAPQDARLVRAAPDQPTGELPFDRGTADVPAPEATAASGAGGGKDEGARLAQEIVTNKGRIRSDESGVTAESQGVTGRGITAPEAEPTTPMSAETQRLMPNLHALLGEDMPEVAAQLQKAVEDNPELFQAYQQGRISMDSLRNDLAQRVGMSTQDWLHTKVGQAFNEREQVALQAAMIESQARQTDLARDIQAKGGVDALLPEQLAYSIHSLVDAQRLAAVARGGRATAGRSLNALKQRFTRELASSITASNERKAAQRTADQARRAVKRSNDLLTKTRTLETERDAVLQRNGVDPATAPNGAVGTERTVRGQPPNIVDQIAQAYDELDRYNALSLHEKEADFNARRAERDKLAAQRKAVVRDAPDELLKALQNELKWERGNFAKRKDTWETMAFWDSKAGENAAKARADFRGGLYIEQQRRVAQNALKEADTTASQAFDAEMRRRDNQSAKAQRLLESMGGVEVNKELLQNFVNAINDPDPMVAAKFIQGTIKPSNWMRANAIRLAGLLSSPITQMVNIGGNISGAMVEVPTRALVVGIDAMRAAATGGERQAYAGELLPMLKAYGPGVLSGLPEAVRIMKTGMSTEDIANLNRIRPGFNSGNAGVDMAVEAPLRALKAEDALFTAGAHSAHAMRVATREAIREGYSGPQVQGRAASIIKNLVDYPELATEVELATKRQVFQEKRTVPGMPSGIGQNDVSRFATSQVLPFVRTPANITAQGAGMSPFGVLGVGEAIRGVSGKEGAARGRQVLLAEERAARTVLGSLIFGAGLAVGGAGMLTGAYPTDPKEASTLPQGWRAWSLRVGDPITKNTYYVPFQNLGPMGFPLALSAILTDPQHRGKTVLDPDEQINAATAIGRYVIDNTFLQGVSDVVDLLHDPKTGASKFMEPYAASWGPYSSLAREMQRVMGVATRNPHDGAIGLVEALEANYPGLSGNVPEATTSLGDPRTQGATGLGRALPLRYDIERDEPTLKALRDNGVGIPQQTKAISLSGGSIPLTEAEQDQLKRARGAAIRDIVPRVGNNPAALQRAVELATAAATRQFISQMGAAEVRKRWEPKQAPEPYYLGTAAD